MFFFCFFVFFFVLGEKGFLLDVFFLSLSIYKCIHTHARERETNNATVDCDDEAVGRERETRETRGRQ